MRQSGILAAAVLYALDHHIDRLAEDHENARTIARTIDGAGGARVVPPDTNIVMIDLPTGARRHRSSPRREGRGRPRVGMDGDAHSHGDAPRRDRRTTRSAPPKSCAMRSSEPSSRLARPLYLSASFIQSTHADSDAQRLRGNARADRAAHQAHAAADVAPAERAQRASTFGSRRRCSSASGSYKIRGPLNKFALMSGGAETARRRLLVRRQSRAGRGAGGEDSRDSRRGLHGRRTPRRRRSPRRKATAPRSCCTARSGTKPTRRRRSSCATEGLTYVHPFDDEQLIAGQGTLGLEIVQDWPDVDAVDRSDRRRRADRRRLDGGQESQPEHQGDRRRVVGRSGDAAQRRGGRASRRSTARRSSTACAFGARASSTSRSCSDSSTRSSRCPIARSSTR